MHKILLYIKWVNRNSRGNRGSILLLIVLGIVITLLNLFFISVSKNLIDTAVNSGADNELMRSRLMRLSTLLVTTMVVRVVLNSVRSHLDNNTYVKVNFRVRYKLFSNLLRSEWLGKEKMHSGDTMNRLFTDVDTSTSVVCRDVPNIILYTFQLITAVVFLATMNLRLAIILLCISPALAAFSKLFFKRMRNLTVSIRDSESRIQSHIQESLQHRTVLLSLDNEDVAENRLGVLQSSEFSQVARRTRFNVFSQTVVRLAFGAGYAIALLSGVFGIWSGTITFGVMTAFLQLVGQVQGPAMSLTQQLPALISAVASIDRIIEIEGDPSEKKDDPILLDSPAGVCIENLTFAYPDSNRTILRNFSHDFKPGSKTALIGETGIGKSTVIRLMLSLLKPQEGCISLYNEKTRVVAGPRTRVNYVYVPQGNTLFSGTIRDNLLMGNPDASEKQMWEALDMAAAEFVREIPDGLDTVCGERGTGLSEGQAQRIAIARGILRPGSILLLDEFSSSLDSETETRLVQRLMESAKDKTIIIITHREGAAKYCNETLRLG